MPRLLLLLPLLLAGQDPPPFTEALLVTVPPESYHIPDVSPTLTSVAYVTGDVGKQTLYWNGATYGPYYEVGVACFSADGKHIALGFRNEQHGRSHLLIDGAPVKGTEAFTRDVGAPILSRDGRLLAFRGSMDWDQTNLREFTVIGTKRYGPFSSNPDPIVTPDGKHWIVPSWIEDSPLSVNIDGRTTQYDADLYNGGAFAPDGRSWALIIGKGKKYWVQHGKQKGAEFDEIRRVVFSPDGKTMAYAARGNNMWKVVVNGKPGPDYDVVGDPVFSADSANMAYVAGNGKSVATTPVINGKEEKPFHGVDPFQRHHYAFSPDGKTLAFFAWDAAENEGIYLVAGDKRSPKYHGAGGLVWNADGTSIAFWSSTPDKLKGTEYWRRVLKVK